MLYEDSRYAARSAAGSDHPNVVEKTVEPRAAIWGASARVAGRVCVVMSWGCFG